MPKSNFLLVDLNEPKTRKLAETITSDTSRKILNHLAEGDEREHTEQKISLALQIPISTVHYHLQKLQEAGLVTVKEFHYSPKGREVNHYRLANKYIIIAPQKVEGLRQKLRGILPVAGIILGISAVMKIVQWYVSGPGIMSEARSLAREAAPAMAEKATSQALEAGMMDTVTAAQTMVPTSPDIALWFLVGGLSSIILYVLVSWWWGRRK